MIIKQCINIFICVLNIANDSDIDKAFGLMDQMHYDKNKKFC